MSQRRSKNRRLSARRSNASGFLNDDTNVYDNNDPLWYDRTAVRPSTSVRMSKNTTPILNPDSTIHASQLSDNWFVNLSQSDTSKLPEEGVKKRISKQNEAQGDSDHRSAATESESEHEFQKKRANLRAIRKPSNKIDKSNAFMKALEKTTDSHARNLTHAQELEGNESESTHDDSRTIRKLRPKFTKHAKNDINHFDKALESDSASERVETSKRILRSSSKRVSETNDEFATPEKQQRLKKSTAQKIVDVSHKNKSVKQLQHKSVDKSKDESIAESSVRKLRNRNITISPTKSATPAKSARKSTDTKKRPAVDQSPDSSSRSPKVEKHKRQLFSQGNKSTTEKSKGDKSAFDAALDSVNDNQENEATITEAVSNSKGNEQEDHVDDDDDSDSSSIPQNIRRTRSRSLFGERNSGAIGDVNTSKNKARAREKDSSKNVLQSSKDKSTANQSNASDKQRTSLKNLMIAESSDDEDIYNSSFTRNKAIEQEKSNKSMSGKSQTSSVETGETRNINTTKNKSRAQEKDSSKNVSQSSKDKSAANQSNASDKQETSRKNLPIPESSDDEDIYDSSFTRSKAIEQEKINKNASGKSQALSVETDGTEDVSTSKNKSRAQKKDSSKNVSQSSKDKSATNQSNASDKQETNIKNLTTAESSDDEDINSSSFTRNKSIEQEKSNKSVSSKSQISSIETATPSDSEYVVDSSPSETKQSETSKSDKTESSKGQMSSIETSDNENIINVSASKIKQREADASKKSNKLSTKANKSEVSKSTSSDKDEDVLTSPDLTQRKSRSRLFQKKNTSKNENAFDQILFNKSSSVKDKTKEKEIGDTPRLSQQSSKVTNRSKSNSTSQGSNKNESQVDQSEDETSTIPQHIRRTRSQVFQKFKAVDGDNAFEDALEIKNVPENRSELNQKSRTLNKSANKSISVTRETVTNKSILKGMKNKPKIINDQLVRPVDSAVNPKENQENIQPSPRKSVANSSLNKGKPVRNSQIEATSDSQSVENSSDGTPAPVSPLEASTPLVPLALSKKLLKRTSAIPGHVKSVQSGFIDDLLHTTNPAQSTLNPYGKPLNRITQFSFRTFADLEERAPPAVAEAPQAGPSQMLENGENVDVTSESDISNYPLLSRQLKDIPHDEENSDEHEKVPVVRKSPKKKKQINVNNNNNDNNNEKETTIDWEKAKQHTDAVKIMVEAQMRLAEEARKKRELEKQRIDAKVKRLQARREAERKRKKKKPIHKAFLVNGKVYKQPKLPRPKSWATDKLYKYLWKCIEPKFGIRARIISEKFVIQLSDFATRITKRKKFENYRRELDEIIMTMAKLGIIETRYDFHRFAVDFMPYSFREKVNPIMLPGNIRNIPYDLELLNVPLLRESRNSQESSSDES